MLRTHFESVQRELHAIAWLPLFPIVQQSVNYCPLQVHFRDGIEGSQLSIHPKLVINTLATTTGHLVFPLLPITGRFTRDLANNSRPIMKHCIICIYKMVFRIKLNLQRRKSVYMISFQDFKNLIRGLNFIIICIRG